jgi:zinc protease
MTRAIILLFVSALLANAQARRPSVGQIPAFSPPPVADDTIRGMRVSFVPYGAAPTARVELVLRSGRAAEQAGEAGLAQLVGDYLLEGTRARSGKDLALELATIGTVGGGLAISVGTFETIIAGEVLSESATRLVEILAEVATSPAFDPAAFERLKEGVKRRSQVTGSASIAAARVNAILFPGDPADRVPTDSTIAALTLDDVRRFHAREYVTARAQLYVAGVFDRSAIETAARTAFRPMPEGTMPAAVPTTTSRTLWTDSLPVVHVIDRPGATQTRIHVAYPVVDQTHPDHLVLNQLNTVMGSVQTSRIIANLRERRGYSYNISTRLARRPGATTWTVQGDVNREVTGAALREILLEVERVRTEPPSATELGEFQRFMAGGNIAEMSTARGIIEYLRFFDLYGADRRLLRTLIPSIQGVTTRDILRVHSAYLRPDRRVIVLVGDASQIEPQLRDWTRVIR